MAATVVTGALLSAAFTVLIEKLASSKVLDLFTHQKLDETLLRKLKLQLISVGPLLVDPEENHITDRTVKRWLNNLKDAVCEAEEFLDELGAEMTAATQASTSQLLNMIGFLDPRKKREKEMASKLKELVQIFEVILEAKDALGLTPGNLGNQERTPTLLNRKTTSLVDESSVFGWDGDKEAIVKLLLSDDPDNILSVVGMGGMGKTTLAQLLFNNSQVKERFNKLIWVYVSEEVDFIKMIKKILKEIGSSQCDSMTQKQLQIELHEKVRGERILLIMDDVRNNIDWEALLKPLNSVERGSKILVTTRQERVLPKMKGVSSHQLKELSEEDCWSLFAHYAAFDRHGSDAYLKELGTKIIRKCNRLPLAVKTIGSLLFSERRAREWEHILESNIWDVDDGKIIPALRLSYHYLSSHLKQCFVYCAMFPKDFEFRKEELIYLWMGEGFIVQNNNGKRELEEIGEKYFEDLLSRSFFQKYEREYDENCFVMHDLLNDLAKSIAGEFCYNNVEDNSSKLTEKTRHLFYKVRDGCNIFEELENISKKTKCLRTFISPRDSNSGYGDVVNLLPRFGRLRVLCLSKDGEFPTLSWTPKDGGINMSCLDSSVKHLRYMELSVLPILNLPKTMPYLQRLILGACWKLTSLPDTIGNMKDLRHLSICYTDIESLPDSIGNLKNLRHLDLSLNCCIERLPESICDLVNLCHLDIRHTELKSMPPQMGNLIKLQTLAYFVVGKEEGFGIANWKTFGI